MWKVDEPRKEDPELSLGVRRVWTERILEGDFLQPFGFKLRLRTWTQGSQAMAGGQGSDGKQQLSLSQGTVGGKEVETSGSVLLGH